MPEEGNGSGDKLSGQNDEVCEHLVDDHKSPEGEPPDNKRVTRKGLIHQCFLAAVIAIAAIGGGMPIGYSAVLLPQLKAVNGSLQIDDEMGSWIASVHSMATPVGAIISGAFMNNFGRRSTIQMASVPFTIGWICIGIADRHFLILIGRLFTGAAVTLTLAPSGVYLAEISHPDVRGVLCCVTHASFIFGMFLVYLFGALLNWRLVAGLGAVCPLVTAFALFPFPKSPVWLVQEGKVVEANDASLWYRGGNIVEAEKEVQLLVKRKQEEQAQKAQSDSLWTTLSSPQFLKPFTIINIFHFLQIFTGPYVIIFYAVDIISYMGIEDINSYIAAVSTAGIRFIFTILGTVLLAFVGRRAIGLGSAIGTSITALCLAAILYYDLNRNSCLPAIFLLFYVASVTVGIATLPGVMVGELFPAKIRGTAISIAYTVLNLLLFGSIKLFPFFKSLLGIRGFFLAFGIAAAVTSLFIYCVLPETRGKTLSEIEDYFLQDNLLWITRRRGHRKNTPEKV